MFLKFQNIPKIQFKKNPKISKNKKKIKKNPEVLKFLKNLKFQKIH